MKQYSNRHPDDRRDNVEKLQYNIGKTIQNMELAEETMSMTDNEQTKKEIQEKNKRREAALDGMRKEIKDEAIDKKNGYK